MSSTWIDWREIFEEDMKNPEFRERFEKGYAEFKKQNEAELAAERAVRSPYSSDSSRHYGGNTPETRAL